MNGHPRLLAVILVTALLGVLGGLIYAFSDRAQTTSAWCRDLEGVKTALRDEENADWAVLPENLKLLKIKPTRPLMRRFASAHERALARFAPRPC